MDQEPRPSLGQPWVGQEPQPRPEEMTVAEDRAAGNIEIAHAANYADLNQPIVAAETAVPVETQPAEPVAVPETKKPGFLERIRKLKQSFRELMDELDELEEEAKRTEVGP